MNCDLLLGLSLMHHAVNRWETIRNQPDVCRAKTVHTSQEVYHQKTRMRVEGEKKPDQTAGRRIKAFYFLLLYSTSAMVCSSRVFSETETRVQPLYDVTGFSVLERDAIAEKPARIRRAVASGSEESGSNNL